jgi:hypothetical protein
MTTSRFCPACGQTIEPADRFCRSCGHSLSDEVSVDPAGPATSASEAGIAAAKTRQRRPVVWLVPLVLVLAAATALAVLAVGGALSDGGADAAARERAALAAKRSAAKPEFDRLMEHRDTLFGQERRYLSAMTDVRSAIKRYRSEDADFKAENKRIQEEFADEFDQCFRTGLPCPEPEYPDVPKVPSFGTQTKKLRAVAGKLLELRATLDSITARQSLRVLHTQLLASVSALNSEAEHNADVLDEAVAPPEGEDSGTLDKGKLRTLRSASALPAIRQLNAAASDVIDALQLPKHAYDVPGGRDFDSDDHSNEV